MGRGIGSDGRAELLSRAGVWTVFCAPGDAQVVETLSRETDRGRAPLVPGYVEVGMTRRGVVDELMTMRVVARRSALELLGMVKDARRWRVLALCVVDDQAGEVHLGLSMPSAVVWSIAERKAEGDGDPLCDVVLAAYLDVDRGYAWRRTFAGPGWLARYAESVGD